MLVGGARTGSHERQYNEPLTSVCVLLDRPVDTANKYAIVMRPHHDAPLIKVSHYHWLHDALIFPLLFPGLPIAALACTTTLTTATHDRTHDRH